MMKILAAPLFALMLAGAGGGIAYAADAMQSDSMSNDAMSGGAMKSDGAMKPQK
jgi:pentapeptide MXKDX repeat protein